MLVYLKKKEDIAILQNKRGICGKVFDSKNKFMTHRKMDHTDKVQQCIKHRNDQCIFDQNCWYIHIDDSEESFSEY